jgi:hypothetical protein
MAKQGLVVLTSSHKCVRDELSKYDQDGFAIVTITPSYSLKNKWIYKLRDRYLSDPSEKNIAALKNAEECYDDNIREIASESAFSHIFINSMDYSLRSIVNALCSIYSNKSRAYSYKNFRDDREEDTF